MSLHAVSNMGVEAARSFQRPAIPCYSHSLSKQYTPFVPTSGLWTWQSPKDAGCSHSIQALAHPQRCDISRVLLHIPFACAPAGEVSSQLRIPSLVCKVRLVRAAAPRERAPLLVAAREEGISYFVEELGVNETGPVLAEPGCSGAGVNHPDGNAPSAASGWLLIAGTTHPPCRALGLAAIHETQLPCSRQDWQLLRPPSEHIPVEDIDVHRVSHSCSLYMQAPAALARESVCCAPESRFPKFVSGPSGRVRKSRRRAACACLGHRCTWPSRCAP